MFLNRKKHSLVYILLALISLIIVSCKSEKIEEKKSLQEKVITDSKLLENKFEIELTKPKNGLLKGVVELGASGFNCFIIEVDEQLNWELKSKDFGNSYILDKKTDKEKILKKFEKYIESMLAFGVKEENINFVISSGAVKEKLTGLVINELKNIGYKVKVVSAEEEGIYALKSVLPLSFYKNSYVVDIGSGNTKITYVKDDNSLVSFETYGAKYFKEKVKNEDVFKEVKKIAENIPKERRLNCFVIGGVPYKLAKSVRKNKERYTVLGTNINDYKEIAEKGGKKIESGLQIYKGVVEATGTQKIVFDWDANFTIGFLLSQN